MTWAFFKAMEGLRRQNKKASVELTSCFFPFSFTLKPHFWLGVTWWGDENRLVYFPWIFSGYGQGREVHPPPPAARSHWELCTPRNPRFETRAWTQAVTDDLFLSVGAGKMGHQKNSVFFHAFFFFIPHPLVVGRAGVVIDQFGHVIFAFHVLGMLFKEYSIHCGSGLRQ